MSYFNKEQEEYMAHLATIPDDQRCYCGWYRAGECYSCNRSEKTKGKTRADRIKEKSTQPTKGASRE